MGKVSHRHGRQETIVRALRLLILLALLIGNWTEARCQDQLAPVSAPGSTLIHGTASERSNAHPSSASTPIGRAPLGRRLSFSDFRSTVSQSLAWRTANGTGDPIGCGLAPRGMPCIDAAQGLAALWVPVSGIGQPILRASPDRSSRSFLHA